jgi:ATP-dependent helicase/nuclease subunit B
MSLKYIFGGSGFGKTYVCLNNIKEELKKDDNSPLIYIVPEQFTHQSEKNLIDTLEESSLIRIQVLSFKRLGFYLFSKTGGVPKNIIDDVSKAMVIKKIILDKKPELLYYGQSAEKPGFIDNVGEIITEFFQYNVKIDCLNEVLIKTEKNDSLYGKIHDLNLIYQCYMQYLSDDFISNDKILSLLPEKIMSTDILNNCKIWVDSFDGFTPQEIKVLEALIVKSQKINIALTIKDDKISYNNLKESDNFFETKNTLNQISKIANDKNIKIEPPIFLKVANRFSNCKELEYLEENYFNNYNTAYKDEVKNICINTSANVYDEVNNVATQILSLVRDKGLKYSDICILTGDIDYYKKVIDLVFYKYDITYFIDKKEDIMLHPVVELVRSSLDIIISNWSYENVCRFIKTGMTSLSSDEISILENYILRFGVKGYKWSLEQWIYPVESDEFNMDDINYYKEIVTVALKPLIEGFNIKKELTVKEYCIKIFKMIEVLNVRTILEEQTNYYIETENYDLANKNSQAWHSVCNLFEKIIEVLGEEKISFKEFSKLIESGLKTIEISTIPPVQDKVIIGDFERSRFPKIKALFVIGTNDGKIPKVKDEPSLLNDEEKYKLNDLGINISPDSNRKSYKQQFLIYSAITNSQKYLYFSYITGNLEGKAIKPSPLINKITKMLPKIEIINNNTNISLPKAMFFDTGSILRNYINTGEIKDIDKAMYIWFKENDKYKNKIKFMEECIISSQEDEYLSQKAINEYYGKEIKTSVSRLEKYVQCPYSYFVKYNLNANERKLYELQPIDYGNLFHDILEMFTNIIDSRNLEWCKIQIDEIKPIVDTCIDELLKNSKNEILQSSNKYNYVISQINKTACTSIWALIQHIKAGSFKPYGAEILFKDNSPITSINIEIDNNKKIILTGKIDRVDIFSDDNNDKYIKIIDYKSGNTKFDLNDLYFGTQLQLIIYIDAFIKNSKKIFGEKNVNMSIKPGGVFYFNIKNPIVDMNEKFKEEDIEDLILKSFKMSGIVQSENDIFTKMDNNIKGYSKILPVNIKKDGTLGSESSVADIETFDKIREYAINKAKAIGTSIFEGNINVMPFKKGTKTACDYCEYNAICMFELKESKNKYNVVKQNKF